MEHNLLTLDFWQDSVTYESTTMPTGTLGCEVLNISDSTIEKLSDLCTSCFTAVIAVVISDFIPFPPVSE